MYDLFQTLVQNNVVNTLKNKTMLNITIFSTLVIQDKSFYCRRTNSRPDIIALEILVCGL